MSRLTKWYTLEENIYQLYLNNAVFKITNIEKDMEKSEPFYTALGDEKWCNHFRKVWLFLKRLNTDQSILKQTICSWEMKTYTHKRNFTQIFIATLLRDRCVNKPILSLNEWISKCGMSTGWNIIWPKNWMICASAWLTLENIMLGKINLNTKEPVFYYSTYMRNPE